MEKLREFFAGIWQTSLTTVLGAALTIFLLFFRLGSMTTGFSSEEIAALKGTGSLKAIAENPLYLPYKLGEYILLKLNINLPIAIRGVSALIGFFCVWGFYLLMKRWHTRRVAILGTLMFLCSTWFLATARSATPTILYVFNILSIIFIGALVHQKKASKFSLLLAAVCSAIMIYSPGLIWLFLLGLIWQYRGVISLLKANPVWLWVSSTIIFVILLLPAAYAIYHNPHFALDILAVPKTFLPLEVAKRFLLVPKELFVQGPAGSYWLARLPIMDLFIGTMFAVGFYSYYLQFKLPRTRFLFGVSLVLITLIALVSVPTVSMLPVVYIIVASGVTLLLRQWLTVFPRNPLARNVGFSIVLIAVLASSWFQLNRYFVAWRHSNATKAAYQLKLQR